MDQPVGHHTLRQGLATDRRQDGDHIRTMRARLRPPDVAAPKACTQVSNPEARAARGTRSAWFGACRRRSAAP
jgi:hypothetical protein